MVRVDVPSLGRLGARTSVPPPNILAEPLARKPRLLLLHKYGRQAASFRHRLLQYVPYLERAGFDCTVSTLFEGTYLTNVLKYGRRDLPSGLWALIRRSRFLLARERFDLAVVCLELLPYLPAFAERFLLGRLPYIYDYDDAVFHSYEQSSSRLVRAFLGNKIRRTVAGATAVLAGNRYLASYAEQVNGRVTLMPTVVDLARYERTAQFTHPSFTIGWIGSPSTATYLSGLLPVVERLREADDLRLLVVGAGAAVPAGLSADHRVWSEESEVNDMLEFDVGIMPLTDDPWSRGKSGFKLIQYMACGLPVIASPVGVNSELVQHGVNGFLASTPDEWAAAIRTLRGDRQLRKVMGRAGRMLVEREYCLQVTAPRFVAAIRNSLQK